MPFRVKYLSMVFHNLEKGTKKISPILIFFIWMSGIFMWGKLQVIFGSVTLILILTRLFKENLDFNWRFKTKKSFTSNFSSRQNHHKEQICTSLNHTCIINFPTKVKKTFPQETNRITFVDDFSDKWWKFLRISYQSQIFFEYISRKEK